MGSARICINKISDIFNKYKFLLGVLLGLIIFLMMFGFKMLNVTNIAWTLGGGDLSFHQIGWEFYRDSPWSFPFGMIEGLDFDKEVCMIYLDVIPIVAFIFKVISFVLPENFQYWGIWLCFCFCMQGGFSSTIVSRFTNSGINIVLQTIILVCSPYFLYRVNAHNALSAHWLILWAILLWLKKDEITWKNKSIQWVVLVTASSLIHLYFVPIIVGIMFFSFLHDCLDQKKVIRNCVLTFILACVSGLLCLILIGAFSDGASLSSDGLGYYNANLNFWVNPVFDSSALLKQLPTATGGQYEGMGYAGIGVLTLCLVTFLSAICQISRINKDFIKKYKNLFISMLLCVICFVVLSVGNMVSINDKILNNICYPDSINKFLGVFRSTGRFVWPVCYIIAIGGCALYSKLSKKISTWFALLLGCCMLQVIDIMPIVESRKIVMQDKQSLLRSAAWDELGETYSKIAFIPIDFTLKEENSLLTDFAKLANKHNMKLSFFKNPRMDMEHVVAVEDELIKNLDAGHPNEDTIYVFENFSFADNNYPLYYYIIDELLVGIPKKHGSMKEITGENLMMSISKDKIYVNNNQNLPFIDIYPGTFSFGPYVELEKGGYVAEYVGTNINDIVIVEVMSGSVKYNASMLRKEQNKIIIQFDLPDRVPALEIKFYNNGDNCMQILEGKIMPYNEKEWSRYE